MLHANASWTLDLIHYTHWRECTLQRLTIAAPSSEWHIASAEWAVCGYCGSYLLCARRRTQRKKKHTHTHLELLGCSCAALSIRFLCVWQHVLWVRVFVHMAVCIGFSILILRKKSDTPFVDLWVCFFVFLSLSWLAINLYAGRYSMWCGHYYYYATSSACLCYMRYTSGHNTYLWHHIMIHMRRRKYKL